MNKAAAIKSVLEQGSFSAGEIAQKSGVPITVVSAYLSQYADGWSIQKTGVRRAYRYGIGATESGQEAGGTAAVADAVGSG